MPGPEAGLPTLYPLTQLVEPHRFCNVALFKRKPFPLVLSPWLLPFTGPLAPSIKSLSSGLEILLFERGAQARASYKISRLEVIFMGPWAGALFRPFSGARKRAPSSPLARAGTLPQTGVRHIRYWRNKGTTCFGHSRKRRAGPKLGLPTHYPLTRLG